MATTDRFTQKQIGCLCFRARKAELIASSLLVVVQAAHSNMCRTWEDTHVCCRKRRTGNEVNSDRVGKIERHTRRRPRPISGGAFAAITLSVALASAITAAGSSNPTPPPATTSTGRKQDRRWVGWSTTPPVPPPDPSFPNSGSGSGVSDQRHDAFSGSSNTLDHGERGAWVGAAAGTAGPGVSERSGFDVDGSSNHMERETQATLGEDQRMGGPPQEQQYFRQAGQVPQPQRPSVPPQQPQHGMMGMSQHHGAQGAGPPVYGEENELEVGNARREQTTGQVGDTSQPPPWGNPYVPPPPPRAPGLGPVHDGVTSARPEDFRDSVPSGSYPNAPPVGPQHPPSESVMHGHGASGERSERSRIDRMWETSPALPGSRVGAVTPEVSKGRRSGTLFLGLSTRVDHDAD